MRAHELVQEWKAHIEENGFMSLGEFRAYRGCRVGLSATAERVDIGSDDDLDEIELAIEDREQRAAKKTQPVKKFSKKDQARIIYDDIAGKGHGRKMTIQRFIDVLGLSPAGASTYYSNFKLNKW